MEGFGYMPIEDDHYGTDEGGAFYFKFTNGKSQIHIESESYDGDYIMIGKTSRDGKRSSINLSTRKGDAPTEKRVFQSYDDWAAIMRYFYDNKHEDFAMMAWLCSGLGRRVGDIIAIKWKALFNPNGTYREHLELKEFKTGKIVRPLINDFVKMGLDEYIHKNGIDVKSVYHSRIFIEDIDDDNKDALGKTIKNKYEKFRTMLNKAAEVCGLPYAIGTHSFRKWYTNTMYKLNTHDPDILEELRNAMGHSSIDTTIRYAELFSDKVHKANKAFSDYMLNKLKGIDVEINNSPVVTLRMEDFRNILSLCWDKAQSGAEKYDGLNEILSAAEKLML